MNNFWNIVGFEFKKTFQRKTTTVALLAVIALTLFACFNFVVGDVYVDGFIYESRATRVEKEIYFGKQLEGRALDSDMIEDISNSHKKVDFSKKDAVISPEYETYIRPYFAPSMTIRHVFDIKSSDIEELAGITSEQANNFYDIRNEKVNNFISKQNLSENTKKELINMNEKIDTPFDLGYTGGYENLYRILSTSIQFVLLALAIIISPIFTFEYTNKTDNLILSSKNGKKSQIFAKIFTASSISFFVVTLLIAIAFFTCMFLFGYDGTQNLPIQLLSLYCPYPITFSQLALITILGCVISSILICGISLLVSALSQNSFISLTIMITLILAGNMSVISAGLGADFEKYVSLLLPVKYADSTILAHSSFVYEVFGQSIAPFIFMPIFGFFASLMLFSLAFKGFKNHQVA